MSQYSYSLLTIPYNSCSAFYFFIQLSIVEVLILLNTIKYHRRTLAKTIWKSFEVLMKSMFGAPRKFQSEWSDIVLKDTSKGMKCLMVLIKLIQVFVRWATFTSGCRPKTDIWVFIEYPDGATYHSFRKIIEAKDSLWHIKILVYNTKDLVSLIFINMLSLFAPPTHVHRYRKKFCTCKDGT